jgi:hypothetical protein
MTDMEERYTKESTRLQVGERRRKFELEGYGADLQAMKKKINFYQKYIGKLRKLVNEDNELVDFSDEGEEGQEEGGEENREGYVNTTEGEEPGENEDDQ